MSMLIDDILKKHMSYKCALYGLGTETERFLAEYGDDLTIIGLLDSFRSDGEMYGYPIIPIEMLPEKNVSLIIVVARPGSCKAIAKRIGDFCREKDIELFDVRGRNLLNTALVTYDFKNVSGATRQELLDKATNVDVISFDLFDTLVMRKTMSYIDVFELVDIKLREKGIIIPEFGKKRLFAEKELSKKLAPRLDQIYDLVLKESGVSIIIAAELAEMEWKLDSTLMVERNAVAELFRAFVSSGKMVVVTTDNYYSKEQVAGILERFNMTGYNDILVSCEYGTAKTQSLFDALLEKYKDLRILHIGDDEFADIEKADSKGIDTYRIYSANDLLDALGGIGAEAEINTLEDRVKTGLFISNIFNDPFVFEKEERSLIVKDSTDIGYLFCAPMITDFVHWMKDKTIKQGYEHILFGARDGFLIEELYKLIDKKNRGRYFLTSRTAAIRAAMFSKEDIDYVDSMKYSGTPEDALRVRFGIEVDDVSIIDRNAEIIDRSKRLRDNYIRYIEKLDIKDGVIAFFDFVAKGTTQMYLQKLFAQHMKGFYFLQLEPEFMADKGLDIEPFYSDEEKNTSSIFDNYYIIETILTAPYPQLMEFDDDGIPIYAEETRTEQDIKCFERAQKGIGEYFKDYISILPESARKSNKKLDEKLLELVNKVKIMDEDFLSLKVEDPFFGRMTDIRDVLG